MTDEKCKVAPTLELDGKKYKVVDPRDNCAAINRVLAQHEGATVVSPREYELMTKLRKRNGKTE